MESSTLASDPAFLAVLERLSLTARRAARVARGPRRRRAARPQAAAAGAGVLRDRRPYAAGDDPRAIDWPAYARLGRLFVKLVEPEEPQDVLLCIDVSASMASPARKLSHARRVAAAAAVIALARPARAGVAAFSDRVTAELPPRAGRGATARALAFLDALEPGGGGELPLRALEDVATRARRPSLAVVISDALWPGDVARPLGRLAAAGHAVALVRIDEPSERDPGLSGALAVESAEGGKVLSLEADEAFRDAYRDAHDAHQAAVAHACRRIGAVLVEAPTEAPVEEAILDLVQAGGLTHG